MRSERGERCEKQANGVKYSRQVSSGLLGVKEMEEEKQS